MKFNQVTALAAAAIIIPLSGTIAHLSSSTESALAESGQSTLIAQDSEAPAGKRRGKKRGGKLLEELDLTEEQKAQIQAIRQEARESRQGRRQEMRALKDKMRQLYASDASQDELRAVHQETKELRQTFGEQRFETKLKIREVLTLEQREKLMELKSQRRGRRGPRGPQSFNF